MEDQDLTNFLQSKDFKSRDVPYSRKLMKYMKSLPSLSQLTVDRDMFNAYLLMLSNGRKVDEKEEQSIRL